MWNFKINKNNEAIFQPSSFQIHHQWTAPIALASDYCHPLEHLLVNVLPNISYALLLGSDPFTYLMWWLLVYLGSQTNHSGYRWGQLAQKKNMMNLWKISDCGLDIWVSARFPWYSSREIYCQLWLCWCSGLFTGNKSMIYYTIRKPFKTIESLLKNFSILSLYQNLRN